jgi:Tol biopolymer transport system component
LGQYHKYNNLIKRPLILISSSLLSLKMKIQFVRATKHIFETFAKLVFILLALTLQYGCDSVKTSNSVDYASETIMEPTPFAKGVISTEDNSEFDIMFSPDGLKAYFSRRVPREKQKIYETNFENGSWTQPKVCKFSTDRDEAVSITPNGELFFFGSERPIPDKPNAGNFDMNIWMMKKTGDGWSNPEPLPFPINDVQLEGEEWPSSNNNFLFPLDDETFYYTTMERGSDAIILYETTYKEGVFSSPVEISGIFEDPKYWVYSAVVSPDGKYLVFNSYGAPGGLGGEDIYVSKRTKTGWSQARSIGPKLNSKDEESGPRFSRDGKYFFFTRAENLGDYEFGEWNIYFLETAYLELDKLFE